jgi:hypothetical protein
MRHATLSLALLLASGCGAGLHHQYDHGRAYQQAFDQQADIERESVQDADFELTGIEGLFLRLRVYESTTDAEDTQSVQDTESGK